MEGTRVFSGAAGRVAAAVAALLLALTVSSATATGAAAVTSCRARNATLGTAARSDLQAVLNAARSGDVVVISGVCIGNYTITKDLTLAGVPTTAAPKATLDGNQMGSVITLSGSLTIRGLRIQHGNAPLGGGIRMLAEADLVLRETVVASNTAARGRWWCAGGGIYGFGYSTITLNGGTRIIDNRVQGTHDVGRCDGEAYGGGIFTEGDVIMNGNALVGSNAASYAGGGIYTEEGDVILRRSASVRGNDASEAGGIEAYLGHVVMRGSTTVTGNHADWVGGVYAPEGVWLVGAASVVHNTSDSEAGGVYQSVSACDASSPDPWVGAISPNTPDDPPEVQYVSCL